MISDSLASTVEGWRLLVDNWVLHDPQHPCSENNLLCIDKDIPRTFPGQLSAEECAILHSQLQSFAARHPELGYRSGFSYMVAYLTRLVGSYTAQKLFEYLMYAKGWRQVHLNPSSASALLGKLLHLQCPQLYDNEVFSQHMYIDRVLAIFTHRLELGNHSQMQKLAVIWDGVFRHGVYALLEVIVLMVKQISPTEDVMAILRANFDILTMEQLKGIKVKKPAYYEHL